MNEKILKRMQALLAMANGAANENESEIAMRRLHVLLAKHNVSIVDLQESDQAEQIGEDFFLSYTRPWHKGIIQGIAKLYFCKIWMTRERKAKIYVVGTEINRTFALGMIQSVLHSIHAEANMQANRLYAKGTMWSNFHTSFLNAASIRIWNRCVDLIKASNRGELEDDEGNTLPVLASVYQQNEARCDDFMSTKGLVTGRQAKYSISNAAGAAAGRNAADRVQLTRSIQAKNTQKALGN